MNPQGLEFKNTLEKFIEEAISQLSDVKWSWVSLYIHLCACNENDIVNIMNDFHTYLDNHSDLLQDENPRLIENVNVIYIRIDNNLYELQLSEFWTEIKNDQYNITIFWKWIKKIYGLSSQTIQQN